MAEPNIEAQILLDVSQEKVGKEGQFTKLIRVVQWTKDGQKTGPPKLEKRVIHTESGRGKAQGFELPELEMILTKLDSIKQALST
jgi:hypothetical protein